MRLIFPVEFTFVVRGAIADGILIWKDSYEITGYMCMYQHLVKHAPPYTIYEKYAMIYPFVLNALLYEYGTLENAKLGEELNKIIPEVY